MGSVAEKGILLFLLAVVVLAGWVLIGPRLQQTPPAWPDWIRPGQHSEKRLSDRDVIWTAFAETAPLCWVCADGRKGYCALFGLRGDLVGMMVLYLSFPPQSGQAYWQEITTYFKDEPGFWRYLDQDGCTPDSEWGLDIWGGILP